MSSERPDTTASERKTLVDLLADNRAEILRLLDGITEEQARRSLVPSLTTLLGLVKHASFVERVWFHATLPGRPRAELGIPSQVDDSFRLSSEDTIDAVSEDFRQAAATSDRIALDHDLDDTGLHPRLGEVSLRWMYVHMIEELARHAGHGDILREQILAADGDGRAD